MIKKGFAIIVFVFLLSSFVKNSLEYKKNLSIFQETKQEYEQEKKRNIELKTQKMREKDPSEIEKTIRNKLNMVKKNEIAFIIPPPTSIPTPSSAPTLPVYKQWVKLFMK